MRIIVGFGSRLWVWESSLTPVLMKSSGDAAEEEGYDSAPLDPHSTVLAHMELSPEAVGLRGRRFGFSGSKGNGEAA